MTGRVVVYRTMHQLQQMVDDPSLRPGDGTLMGFGALLQGLRHDTSPRPDHMARVIVDHMADMLRHLRAESLLDYDAPPSKSDDWDELAEAYRPGRPPWETVHMAAIRLQSNARGLSHPQGGTRDIIKG